MAGLQPSSVRGDERVQRVLEFDVELNGPTSSNGPIIRPGTDGGTDDVLGFPNNDERGLILPALPSFSQRIFFILKIILLLNFGLLPPLLPGLSSFKFQQHRSLEELNTLLATDDVFLTVPPDLHLLIFHFMIERTARFEQIKCH